MIIGIHKNSRLFHMILNMVYLLLSIFGLGVLVFIHEWGHFIVAKKMGMRVETFSIGFGKPIKQWKRGDVVFQIGTIPFGGYVKITGMEGNRNIEGGYYQVSFYKRIAVALAGPFANLILALAVFLFIFMIGGRRIEYIEKSPYVGYIYPQSSVAQGGLKEGDRIISVNKVPYTSFNTFAIERITNKGPLQIEAEHFPLNGSGSFTVTAQQGGFFPGAYLIFDKIPNIVPKEMAYLKKAGLVKGDRLLTVNGNPVFSRASLVETLMENKVLLHIKRGEEIIPVRVPKMAPAEIKLDNETRGELTDWTHTLGMKQVQYYIPYGMNSDLVIEKPLEYLNEGAVWVLPGNETDLSYLESPLCAGDRIVAVSGAAVQTPSDMLKALNEDAALIIVQKRKPMTLVPKTADADFWAPYENPVFIDLYKQGKEDTEEVFLGLRIPTIRLDQLKLSESEMKNQMDLYEKEKQRILAIKDAKIRNRELQELDLSQKRPMIGGTFADQIIRYNPNPFKELVSACGLTFKTLASLAKGVLSAKELSGPVAIVGVMQEGAKKSFTEGLYYFAIISVNLALFNLLPLPVLDGGHICFALYEGITRKQVPQKVMERLTFVFVILLVAMILFTTYNDILKFIRGIF